MQPHPAFFTHQFIVCLNPTQPQRQGVWTRARRERDQGGTCYYNLSSIRLHGSSGIIVPCLAWSLARLISPGETQPPTNNTKHNVDWSYTKARGSSTGSRSEKNKADFAEELARKQHDLLFSKTTWLGYHGFSWIICGRCVCTLTSFYTKYCKLNLSKTIKIVPIRVNWHFLGSIKILVDAPILITSIVHLKTEWQGKWLPYYSWCHI